MKNACKRLFSLMLALVLLVSVVPFQAMATDGETEQHNIKVKFLDENGDLLQYALGYYEWIGEKDGLYKDGAADYLAKTDITGYELPDLDAEPVFPKQNNQGVWVYEVTMIPAENSGSDESVDMTPVEPATPVEPEVEEVTVEVYTKKGWAKNITVKKGETIDPADLAEFDREGYKTTWMAGEKVIYPGETPIKEHTVIGPVYDEIVETYDVHFYNGEEWLATIKVNAKNGKIVSGEVPADPTEDGYKFVGWFDKGGHEYRPGKSEVEGDNYTVGAKFEKKNGGDNNNDRDHNVFVTFKYDDGNKTTTVSYYVENLNKSYEISREKAWDLLDDETKIDTDKYQLPENLNRYREYDDGEMYITIKLERKSYDNVFVKFTYDHDQKGETVSYKATDPSGEGFPTGYAKDLMKKANVDTDRYELMLKDGRPVISRKDNHDGTYTYTIALERVRSERKMDITVYVDGERKINDKTIKVYSDETYEDNVFDWINRASDRHYSSYDYKVKSHEFNRDKTELTVKLEKRHSEYDYEISLEIYTNGNKNSPAKTLNITKSSILDDGYLRIEEAEKKVQEYFTRKDKDEKMTFDGLWIKKDAFDKDDAEATIDLRDYRKGHKDVTIVIMAYNAERRTDSGNPKTGDEIFVTVTVMALSATALACAYFFNKKRMAK